MILLIGSPRDTKNILVYWKNLPVTTLLKSAFTTSSSSDYCLSHTLCALDNVWHNGLRYKIFQLDLPTKMTQWPCNTSQRKWFLVQPNKPQSRGSTGFCPESITFSDLRQRSSNSPPQTKFSLPVQ